MPVMPEDYFGEQVAERYDDPLGEMFGPAAIEPAVDVLTDLAGDGAALEFGIGTGRLALPLSRRGVPVHGIDLSPAMLARLAAKPGADQIGVTVGDFAQARVPGSFSLVYLVFNTIMNLTSQDEQVACFGNAATHLAPGGCFVIEVMVPDLQRLPPGETARPFTITETRLGFDTYDLATQRLVSHHYHWDGDRMRSSSIPFRYAWPAELDLMARLAGMSLLHRWSDWHRTAFTGDSRKHISVWQKPR
jgi:SAM-dependent methyltransferase